MAPRNMERPRRPPDFEHDDTRLNEQGDSADDTALLLSKATHDEYKTVYRADRHIRLNVSGMIFRISESTLHQHPNTLLGDPARRQRFYCPETDEYFFDRHRPSFEAIFGFYQRGQKRSEHDENRLIRPKNVPVEIFYLEMKFFDIERDVIKQCLENDYYSEHEETDVQMPKHGGQRAIWLLCDFPDSSLGAKFVGMISAMLIFISIAVFCVETLPEFRQSAPESLPNSTNADHLRLLYTRPLFQAETACIIWFCLELIIRFFACPNKGKFLKDPLNIFDFLAIAPYFVDVIMVVAAYHDSSKPSSSVTFVRLLRLFRIVRIFKLSRHVKGLRVLGKSMVDSIGPFALLIFLIMIAMTLFGSCVYFAEMEQPETNWQSIPDTFWWVIITMTTVGYGDHFPLTTAGKIVGSVCVVSGILTLALPSPAIVANFNKNNEMSKNVISEEILEERLRSDMERIKRKTPRSLINGSGYH
ncbi:PREDICTED: shaker-related potassium channel tsha2-like [Branchiostoma belcheri]|uniref:Shaker-related potassium channel tsha2-like n=1 Tax=Branchiostoma belcheri TaxID=7741 RepID=A0A6P4ZCC2_BRABE|nr:PREDICTED: shaker-related potassium channel tsha2-like [Branchiostoma belcheri]